MLFFTLPNSSCRYNGHPLHCTPGEENHSTLSYSLFLNTIFTLFALHIWP